MKYLLIITITLLLCVEAQARDTSENSFGNGIVNKIAKDSSFSLKFGARFQSLYQSNWSISDDYELSDHSSNMLIRRARLKFDGFAHSPKLEYKLEIGLSNGDIAGASEFTRNAPRLLLDAVLKWNFYQNFELWAGQTKLPGNRERIISSANMQFVDRSLLNSLFNIDRDMGVQLWHQIELGEGFLIKEAVAISQGEGRNVTSENLGGLQWTYRLEFLPFGDFDGACEGSNLQREESPKLALGISYDHNDNAVKTRSNMGSYMITDYGFHQSDINTLFIDAMFNFKSFSFMGEYAQRAADYPIAMNHDGTASGDVVNEGSALNLQAGYLFKSNYELALRYTSLDFDHFNDQVQEQYTLACSKYIVGHKLKVQTDVSYSKYDDAYTDGLMYRLQFDFHL